MDRAQQKEWATSFLAQHHGPPVLLLPNVWDAMSARLFVEEVRRRCAHDQPPRP